MMDKRKCETCIHAKPFGGENDNRCDAWECEYINRKEAIEIWKAYKNGELIRRETDGTDIERRSQKKNNRRT